jgi:hypothetical protein
MSKATKDFKVKLGDITSQLAGKPMPMVAVEVAPPVETPPSVKSTSTRAIFGKNKGLRAGEERVSFVLLEGQYEKLKGMAYWERRTVKDLMIEILEKAINQYEAEKGKVALKS